VGWNELPGWSADRSAEAWPALLRGCERAPPAWVTLCAEARLTTPSDDATTRAWLMQRLQAYRVETLDGSSEGLITGYYEPLIDASRVRRGAFQVPLYSPPADLNTRKPYWTRCQPRRPRCADARSPMSRTRWTRWCCRSRARAGCA